MAKQKDAPFLDQPSSENKFWSLSWFEWLRDLTSRVNERPEISGTITPGNVVTVDADENLVDGGAVPSVPSTTEIEQIVRDYTGPRFLTDNTVPEAGTEEGARHGSLRIGLKTEDDYAYFDEYGRLIMYGDAAGFQVDDPVHLTSAATKFTVFDSTGNIEYRTAAEMVSDMGGILSEIYATRDWVGENFITEAPVLEAELYEDIFSWTPVMRAFMFSLM